MTTGDLKNNLRKLQSELRAVDYIKDVDFESLGNGKTTDFLPIYHFVFNEYSRPLSAKIMEMDVELFGKTDLRFIEGMYKVLREMFAYKPPVTKQQFFAPGFGERKVIMCTQVLQLMRVKHHSLIGSSKFSSTKPRSTLSMLCPTFPDPPTTNCEVAYQTRADVSTVNHQQPRGQTAAVVPVVVNETRSKPNQNVLSLPMSSIGGDSSLRAASHDIPTTAMSVTSASVVDERKRLADDALKSQLLEAFNKINGSVEKISSKLETLDHRLTRLESLEQQLTELSHLERRVADVEQLAVMKAAEPAVVHADDQSNDKMDFINSQLNNLVARMTLVENKLIILQSSEKASSSTGHNCSKLPSSSSSFPSSSSLPASRSPEVTKSLDEHSGTLTSNVELISSTLSDDVQREADDQNCKSTRSEQVDRIQAMLRGTEEMLRTFSKSDNQIRDSSPTSAS